MLKWHLPWRWRRSAAGQSPRRGGAPRWACFAAVLGTLGVLRSHVLVCLLHIAGHLLHNLQAVKQHTQGMPM